MVKKRKRYSAEEKFQVTLEAVRGEKTINEIASEYGIHPNQISKWKRDLLSEGASLFGKGSSTKEKEQEKREAELYEHIGRLKMELEWLEKKSATIS